jgi:hypothetical protein
MATILPTDVGAWVTVKIPGLSKEALRYVTRQSAKDSGRYYARSTPNGPERILHKDTVVVSRGAVPLFALPRTGSATDKSVVPMRAGVAVPPGTSVPAAADKAAPVQTGSFYTPVEADVTLPVGVTAVRNVARDSPIAFLARSLAAHIEGGTDLSREYEASHHGMRLQLRQDPPGHSPRALTVENVDMPKDGWDRGLMDQFLNDFVMKVAETAGFDILSFDVKNSRQMQEWALADWRRRVSDAQTRPGDLPMPLWQALPRPVIDGSYALVRNGLPAGAVMLWKHEH